MQPAKTICAGCPVRTECLDYALADDTLVGVWGGTSETERDHIRNRRRIA
jgi:WhiB family redox-sensing transcriptional regulator